MSRVGIVRFMARILGVYRQPEWWNEAVEVENAYMAKIAGEEARQVLESRAYKRAVNRMNRHIDYKINACDPTSADDMRSVINTKQAFVAFQREFARMIADGEAAEMMEEEKPSKRVFQR